MKYIVLSFIFIHIHINCYSETQKSFFFQYYDIKINVKAGDFILRSESKDHLNLIELNNEFEKILNETFAKNNFDNYSIVDFIVKLSNEASKALDIDETKTLICLLHSFDFKFILIKSESDSAIAVSSNMLVERCILIGNEKFYVLNDVDLYNKKYILAYTENGNNKLSYDMKKEWKLGSNDTLISRDVLYKDSVFQIIYNLNSEYIRYSMDVPFSFSDTVFNVPSPSAMMKTNINRIKKILEKFTLKEQLDFLLRLSQQIFYTDDLAIYNKEKLLLPEATVFLNRADCEDKSLLFSFLVWHIMHIKTVLIAYPNGDHMNVGVEFKNIEFDDKSNFVVIRNIHFLICDPSILWYNVGEQIDKIDTSVQKYIWLNFY